MDLGTVATAFALIFPVELPDKTFVATLVLATRYRPLLVWIGVSAAFVVQCLVAVVAGGLLALLPTALVSAVAGTLFLVGAVVLWRGAGSADEDQAAEEQTAEEQEAAARTIADVHGFKVVATSFGVLFLAEWGDLSQLLTAGLAARYNDPVSVFVGSLLALVTVAGLAVILGRTLLRFVRLSTIRRVGAVVCLVLACLAAYDVVRSF
jgi:putative Ca2+/H+ antiporter (TMEM165/GDT1 family)